MPRAIASPLRAARCQLRVPQRRVIDRRRPRPMPARTHCLRTASARDVLHACLTVASPARVVDLGPHEHLALRMLDSDLMHRPLAEHGGVVDDSALNAGRHRHVGAAGHRERRGNRVGHEITAAHRAAVPRRRHKHRLGDHLLAHIAKAHPLAGYKAHLVEARDERFVVVELVLGLVSRLAHRLGRYEHARHRHVDARCRHPQDVLGALARRE